MSEIQLLDHKTIDCIAAGEVVERPASAAKELMENAIDAGADVITVEIRNGGKTLLRVTDNGSGIEAEQVPLAFLRHATSKLREIEDLTRILSLGFRGEALSSICAVSKTEMITRTKDQIAAFRYVINAGEEEIKEEVGAPFGTTVIVRDLFYNTPAREKFLRSAVSEGNAVAAVTEQLALSHPEISFNLIADGRQKLYTSGSGDLLECAYRIYGREITNCLIAFHAQGKILKADGYIGLPILSRGNRNFETFSINGRFVKDKIISAAIEDAYRGHLMQHRYPFTLFSITTDPQKVDVNVHPAKSEVRFSQKEDVYNDIYNMIREALIRNEEVPSGFSMGSSLRETVKPALQESLPLREEQADGGITQTLPDPVEKAPLKELIPPKMPQPFEQKRLNDVIPQRSEVPELVHEKQMSLFDDSKAGQAEPFKIIGQVFSTFILIEYKDCFYIVDQHAAHEKVLYEKFMKIVSEKKPHTQYLMPAVLLTLSAAENDLFAENLGLFTELGFEIEHFSGREWRITGVPADLFIKDPAEFFTDLLDGLSGMGRQKGNLNELIASKACKAAIKGNTRFSDAELNALIGDLLKLEDPYHCPHGRPVMISMTHYELDKKFKRIV